MKNLVSLLFVFKGRIPRSKYCLGVIVSLVASISLSFISILLIAYINFPSINDFADTPYEVYKTRVESTAGPVTSLIFVTFMYSLFCFTIKRLHDLNVTGWISLILVIPLINFITIIILGCVKGLTCDNQYGPDPFFW
jgi:uncharacterized membrane protein YhaH (DUF805 family)